MANTPRSLTKLKEADRIGTEHLDNEIGAIPSVQTVSRTTPNGCKLTLIFPVNGNTSVRQEIARMLLATVRDHKKAG